MSNKVPHNIAVMVRISLLHLNWELLINIFDSWIFNNDVRNEDSIARRTARTCGSRGNSAMTFPREVKPVL